MIAKRFALGFGVAIILPLLVLYGVKTFSPAPSPETYQVKNYYNRYSKATLSEKQKLGKEREILHKKYDLEMKRFQKHLFFIAVPLGIGAILIGIFSPIPAVGSGLMFGGIFTLLEGYLNYWPELPAWMQFVSLLIAFIILILAGYKKMPVQDKTVA